MCEEEAAILRSICLDPADNTSRLVYADWLQEHDQEEIAVILREFIQYYRNPPSGPTHKTKVQKRLCNVLRGNHPYKTWLDKLLRWAVSFTGTSLWTYDGYICDWEKEAPYKRYVHISRGLPYKIFYYYTQRIKLATDEVAQICLRLPLTKLASYIPNKYVYVSAAEICTFIRDDDEARLTGTTMRDCVDCDVFDSLHRYTSLYKYSRVRVNGEFCSCWGTYEYTGNNAYTLRAAVIAKAILDLGRHKAGFPF